MKGKYFVASIVSIELVATSIDVLHLLIEKKGWSVTMKGAGERGMLSVECRQREPVV
jgi:hypothetical protein